MSWSFNVYQDVKREYRWRLQAENERIVADSGEGYTTKQNCLEVIDVIKKNITTWPPETYVDARQEYRWRLRAANGRIVADSAEGYSSRQACDNAVTRLKQNVPSAIIKS